MLPLLDSSGLHTWSVSEAAVGMRGPGETQLED